jgi:hypothetical protein
VLNLQANSKVTAAATGSIFNHLAYPGATPQGSTMKPLNSVALAGWTNESTQMELLQIGQASAAAVVGTGGVNVPAAEEIAGLVIVPPGALLALMAGTGAGTTWIVNGQLTWAEIELGVLQAMMGD